MPHLTRLLARVWLALALAGAGIATWMIYIGRFQDHGNCPDCYIAEAFALLLGITILILWVLPLACGATAALRGGAWGVSLLRAHAGLGAAGWGLLSLAAGIGALRAIRDRLLYGPYYGGFPSCH